MEKPHAHAPCRRQTHAENQHLATSLGHKVSGIRGQHFMPNDDRQAIDHEVLDCDQGHDGETNSPGAPQCEHHQRAQCDQAKRRCAAAVGEKQIGGFGGQDHRRRQQNPLNQPAHAIRQIPDLGVTIKRAGAR